MAERRVLVVDDEANMRRVLEIMLQRMGFRSHGAENGAAALEFLERQGVDLVISDLQMPQLSGIGLLEKLREGGRSVPVIIITAHGTVESAVTAMKLGAADYLLRPFDMEALQLAIRRVFAAEEVLRANEFLRDEVERGWAGMVGRSAAMQRVYEEVRQVAATRTSVLITGESGTGKELVARAIHRASPRAQQLFVPVNCAAIPADILESEMFGYEKGAFTGAVRDRVGKFELSSGGTIFLDEVAEMPLPLQAKLLRVLQEQTVERLGSNRSLELDLRIIAATNRPPADALREQRLREDLYFRLGVFRIELPPLRTRTEDIPLLVEHFLAGHAPAARAAPGVLERLAAYPWPGNVRELHNVLERALVLAGGRELRDEHILLENAAAPVAGGAAAATLPDPAQGLDAAVRDLESRLIGEALRRCGDNKTRAAALLGISERTIWYKIKKYQIAG